MRRPRGLTLGMGLMLALMASCAKEPKQEINSAREAIEKAKVAEAAEYAPESWRAAEDAWMRLDVELKAQNEAAAYSRSYATAESLATEARAAAEKAATDAVIGKQTAREDAIATIQAARAARDEVTKMLEQAPRGKGTVVDVVTLKADTDSTSSSIADAEVALNAGRYVEAKAKAQAVLQTLDGVKAQIRSAESAQKADRRA